MPTIRHDPHLNSVVELTEALESHLVAHPELRVVQHELSNFDDDIVALHELKVPTTLRGKGSGEAFMQALLKAADILNITIALSIGCGPDGDEALLCLWYRRLGFRHEEGFGCYLLRRPKTQGPKTTRRERRFIDGVKASLLAEYIGQPANSS